MKDFSFVDSSITFTREDARKKKKTSCLFEMCGRSLSTEAYLKLTHTDQYLLLVSHHLLEHKLSVIRSLQHWPEMVPRKTVEKRKGTKIQRERASFRLADIRSGPL